MGGTHTLREPKAAYALDSSRESDTLTLDNTVVVRHGQELFRNHQVSRRTFQAVLEHFGKQGAVELGLIMGN